MKAHQILSTEVAGLAVLKTQGAADGVTAYLAEGGAGCVAAAGLPVAHPGRCRRGSQDTAAATAAAAAWLGLAPRLRRAWTDLLQSIMSSGVARSGHLKLALLLLRLLALTDVAQSGRV